MESIINNYIMENKFISLEKCTFNTLEIRTRDNVSLYVPNQWFLTIFNNLKSDKLRSMEKYNSKTIMLILNVINSFYQDYDYLVTNYFSKLVTMRDISDFVSALIEYNLDACLLIFDKYLSGHAESLFSSEFVNMVLTSNYFKETKNILANIFIHNLQIIKFFNFKNVNQEFVDIFFDYGIKTHLKIFKLWIKENQPTDVQLVNTKIFNHTTAGDIYSRKPIIKKKTVDELFQIIKNLKNADNFKMSFYERILPLLFDIVLDSYYYNRNYSTVNATEKPWKIFISNEVKNLRSIDPDIDNIELILQIRNKWNNRNIQPTKSSNYEGFYQ